MSTDTAAITVAIPTFNRRGLLEQAIASVLDETRVPVRVSVSDNASTDDTAGFMRDLTSRDGRVFYHRNESNLGGIRNIADAVARVDTEYFVPLADDDLLLPDFLHDAYHIMQARPQVGAAVFGTEARTSDDRVVCVYPDYLARGASGEIGPGAHMRLWLRHSHCAWSSILWRTRVLERTGVPYAGIGLPGDVDFQARVFSAFPAFLVNRPGAVYRMHDEQASRGLDITHIPDWATIFGALDRAATALAQPEGREDALPWAEYLELRHEAWSRLRALWNRPTAATLSTAERERLALIAGFRLGDWPLAFDLAGGESDAVAGPSRLFSLPGLGADQSGRFKGGTARSLLLSAMRRLAEGDERERVAAARQQEAEAAREHLERELADHRTREAALVSEVEALRHRCQAAEDRSLVRRIRRFVTQ